jgi:hypothetical protein
LQGKTGDGRWGGLKRGENMSEILELEIEMIKNPSSIFIPSQLHLQYQSFMMCSVNVNP